MPIELPDADPCSFCVTLAGAHPFTVLERGPRVAIFVTREQRGLGHLLVLPVEHRPTVLDLTYEEGAAIMDSVRRAARAVTAAYDPAGICVWQNNGVPAHQAVPHVHVHVAGTYPGRGTEFGRVPRLAVAETDRIGDLLRPHLSG